jgi:hypothetical protein
MRTRTRVPFAERRADTDHDAEQARDLAHDREPQADADARRTDRVDLIVLVEDSVELVRRNADAGVLDEDRERIGIERLRDSHEAALGIFDRIADRDSAAAA